MGLKLKTALEYPLKDISTKGAFSIDVLILYGGELHIGYYDFKNFEWLSTDNGMVFRPQFENELQWTNIPTPTNQTHS